VTSGVPAFFVAYLLMYLLAVRCHWLPALGTGGIRHLWLPWLTLGLTGFQSLARLTRASVAEALHSPWIWTARAKGLSENVVLLRHALRTRLAALLTGVGNTIAATLGRVVIVEVVFGWPGLGRFATYSVVFRDMPAIQGFTLLFGILVLLLYLAVDLLAAQVDPRMRPARAVGGQ
jgi:ABC-type dipeptide/oligopeptide/nickel transport system permease component